MARRIWLVVILGLCLAAPLSAEPATVPPGSAFLRTMPPAAAPFGRLVSTSYPYDGVRMQRWRRDQPAVDWLIVWIDLQTPGLGYRVTPFHYRSGPAGTPIQAAHAQHTLDFLRQAGDAPRVDLAVNAVAYWPFPAYNGSSVYLSEPVWTRDDNQRNPDPPGWMIGLGEGKAVLQEAEIVRAAQPYCAFGSFLEEGPPANGLAVRDGVVVAERSEAHARTVIGASADGRVLMLLVADGYNPGVSIGLGRHEAGQIMQAAGAWNAIFFDGGGSSTLVGRDEFGGAVVLNRPAGQQKQPGTLRYVAINLGFTNLQRSGDPLPALPDWQASCSVTLWNNLVTWSRVHPRRAQALAVGTLVGMLLLAWLCRQRRPTAARGNLRGETASPPV